MNTTPEVVSNVVRFPREKKDSIPQTMEEIVQNVQDTRKELATRIADETLGVMFRQFYEYQIAIKEKDSVEFMKSIALIIEAINSAVYLSLSLDHQLQPITSKIFELVGSDEVRLNLSMFGKGDDVGVLTTEKCANNS